MRPSRCRAGLWKAGRTDSEPGVSIRAESLRAQIPTPLPPQEKQDPHSHFHMDTLLMTTHNLIFGGTETVGTTLRHAFLVLMKYPKVQGARAPSLTRRSCTQRRGAHLLGTHLPLSPAHNQRARPRPACHLAQASWVA